MTGIFETVYFVILLHTASSYFTSPYTVLGPGGTFDIQGSSSQIEIASKVTTIVIPGDPVLDVPATSTITNRYSCNDYAMLFNVAEPDENPYLLTLDIQLIGSVETENKSECTIDWADGGTKGHVKIDKLPLMINHTYSTFGVYEVSMICKIKGNPNATRSCPSYESKCVTTTDFLDDIYKQFQNPMIFLTAEKIVIKSYMELISSSCGVPTITWRITRINGVLFTPISNFVQPMTSVLTLEQGLLEPGEYVVSLEVVFKDKGSRHWSEDLIIVKVVLPELVAHILGGELLDVVHGQEILIDASISTDPAMSMAYFASTPLTANWYFAHFTFSPPEIDLHSFLIDFPVSPLPSGSTKYNIGAGSDYALKINTSMFPVDTYAVAMFTLSRGDRISSAMQMIRFLDNAIPIGIECVYNCHIGRERLFYYNRIELDLKLPDGVDTSAYTYSWQIMRLNNLTHLFETATEAAVETGLDTSSISVTSFLYQGYTYRIRATVSAPGFTQTKVEFIRTVKFVPYNGSCTLNSLEVTSARDWLTMSCSGWKGNDNRKIANAAVDINPILTYTVRQRTIGALVEEEPILQTRSQKAHVILKVGDVNNGYSTTLFIQVADIFKNYFEIELLVKSKPAFNVSLVTPKEEGAVLVRSYTEVDYPFDENQLKNMGKIDMLISLVSAVCSNLHLVYLPVRQPPVPRVLNSKGSILDLNEAGNKDVGTLEEVSAAANNDTIDPATLAIQDVILSMTKLLRDVVESDLVNGSRSGDKLLTSIITNAFTNIAAKPEFVNTDAKAILVYLGEIVGVDALTLPNTTEDVSAQIETASGEIYYMFQAVANAAVPDDLRQIRSVRNLVSGRTQIKDMLSVIGQNLDTNDTKMSPVERAYLYMKMQLKLRLQTNSKKNTAKIAAKSAIDLAKNIQGKLKLCATCSTAGSTKTKQLVKRNKASVITSELLPTETSKFTLSGLQEALGNSSRDAESISVSAYEFKENVFMYDDDGTSSIVTSNVLRIDVKTPEKRVTPGFMTFEQTVLTPSAEQVTPHVNEEDASEFMYHELIYQVATDNVCLIIKPHGDFQFTQYTIYLKFNGPPSLIDFDLKFDILQEKNWQTCLLPEQMKGQTGAINLAVGVPGNIKNYQYNLTIISVGCLTWEEEATKWHTDKCTLEWFPELDKIICYCQQVTDLVFANSFVVAPNSIDFSSVFLKFSPLNQAAVMGTLIGMIIFYVIAVVYLARLDSRDRLEWGITPLRDNFISNTHYYIIKVSTGMRRRSGTRSRVAFVLTGYNADTGPRELFDGVRGEFSTGSIMSFFMATEEHLGALQHLYIWHDNSGESDYDSWYLNQIVVYDTEKHTTYTFVAERWLSLDTTLDTSLSSSPKGSPIQFETRFFNQAKNRLSESHMWLSILYRPQFSTFTRAQRASCALVYVFLTMFANAMYFNPNPDYVSPPLIQVGPLRFTPQQIFISIVCAMMTMPVVMILILLFKRTKKTPPNTKKSCCSCLGKWSCLHCCCFCKYVCCAKKRAERRSYERLLQCRLLTPDIPELSPGVYLPSWFIYFAWLLVLIGTAVPAFFILLYSMEWGKQKSEEWLTTLFLSLVESIFLVDPIMVICISLVLALIIRTNKDDTHIDIDLIVKNYKRIMGDDEDSMRSSLRVLKSIKEEYIWFKSDPIVISPPLRGKSLEEAAHKNYLHVQLLSVVKDILLNLFFMFVVFSICFANRDDRSFLHYSETVNTIVSPAKLPQFNSIKTPGDLYTWINKSVIPNLFPEFYINGSPLHWSLKQFKTGYNDLRLGPPRLRQLRTKNGTCNVPYIGKVDCYGEYTFSDEEENNYCIGWKPQPCAEEESVYNVSEEAWTYKTAFDVWGLPLQGFYTMYGGGGYICPLDVNRDVSLDITSELFRNLWMDRQTRAVVFEFTLYNGATNIFIYNVFLVEFPQTGGAFTSFFVYPIRVYTHQGAVGTYTLLCEIIFVFYLIILLIKICIRVYQQRCGYFKQFWQNYELALLLTGFVAVVLYALRFGLSYVTIREFKKDKKQFVNFSHIVFWDQILVTVLAVMVFLSTLRILEIFATSKKVNAVVRIFEDCGKELFWYGLYFLYIFLGFCVLGVLLFGSQLLGYMNIYQCMGTLFIAMIGKSHFTEINESQPVLAKIFFMLYSCTVVFFILTIFLSILGASIDSVVHETREDKKEDLIELIMRMFTSLFNTPKRTKKRMKVKEIQQSLSPADKIRETFYKMQSPLRPRFLSRKSRRDIDKVVNGTLTDLENKE